MLTFDAPASAALDSPARGIAWLVEFQFSTGTIRATTWPVDLISGGFTWVRAGNALQVDPLVESENLDTRRMEIRVAVTDAATLALAVGDAAVYRGRPAKLYMQVVQTTGAPAGAAVLRWSGVMEAVKVEREQPAAQGQRASMGGQIILVCGRTGVTRSRRREGLRLTDAQQQQRFAGDKGYEYVAGLIEKPALWLSKRFQQV